MKISLAITQAGPCSDDLQADLHVAKRSADHDARRVIFPELSLPAPLLPKPLFKRLKKSGAILTLCNLARLARSPDGYQ
jgi:hypothetical protein